MHSRPCHFMFESSLIFQKPVPISRHCSGQQEWAQVFRLSGVHSVNDLRTVKRRYSILFTRDGFGVQGKIST